MLGNRGLNRLNLGAYSTSSAFIAMFHRMMGITPEEFRKRSGAD
jgi:methylphosphotriester-DNA--protein-cysteine methyltransferase